MRLTKYINVSFPDGNLLVTVGGIYQYDYGVALRIVNIKKADYYTAHFNIEHQNNAIVSATWMDGDDLIIPIPNVILSTKSRIAHCYIYYENNDDQYGYTTSVVNMSIVPRAKPLGLIYTEELHVLFETIKAQFQKINHDIELALSDRALTLETLLGQATNLLQQMTASLALRNQLWESNKQEILELKQQEELRLLQLDLNLSSYGSQIDDMISQNNTSVNILIRTSLQNINSTINNAKKIVGLSVDLMKDEIDSYIMYSRNQISTLLQNKTSLLNQVKQLLTLLLNTVQQQLQLRQQWLLETKQQLNNVLVWKRAGSN